MKPTARVFALSLGLLTLLHPIPATAQNPTTAPGAALPAVLPWEVAPTHLEAFIGPLMPIPTPTPPMAPARPKATPKPSATPKPKPKVVDPRNAGVVPEPWMKCQGRVGSLVKQFFWDDLAWADRVANRESHCRPEAQNRVSSAHNVFQLLDMHNHFWNAEPGCQAARDRYDAYCGIAAARRLYNGSGRRPWGG